MTKKLLGEIELNRIYQRDCIEGMRMIPNDSVDLIVIDPPYNIGKDKRWDKWKTVDAYVEFMAVVFKESERVLKPTGSFYWWHNDFSQIRKLMDSLDNRTNLIFKQFITWDKYNGTAPGHPGRTATYAGQRNYPKQSEYCLFYTFQDDTGLSQVMLDVNNFRTLRDYFDNLRTYIGTTKKAIMDVVGQRADHCFRSNSTQWDLPTPETYEAIAEAFNLRDFADFREYDSLRLEYDSLRLEYDSLRLEYESLRYTFNNNVLPSVWQHEPIPQNGHVTPKPLTLIENIIRTSSNEGDVVLDCFMGSGTTAVAAVRLKRNFIGFEREPEYIEIANKRIDAETEVDG